MSNNIPDHPTSLSKIPEEPQENCYKKFEIVTLTFLAFVGIHALRTTYSFSKSYLPDAIGVEE